MFFQKEIERLVMNDQITHDSIQEHSLIKIRVYRAIDNQEDNRKFADGHFQVLKVFGITMITSAGTGWFTDPDTYVIIVESHDGAKALGGARIQIAGGSFPLPIEAAVTAMDSSIHGKIHDLEKDGVGELCGLWNSKEAAGFGIGSIYLGRVGVIVAAQLHLKTLFALCAPSTVKNCLKIGFKVDISLGHNGTFYYPKEDLLATAVILEDTSNLELAEPYEKERIKSLLENLRQTADEAGPRGDVHIEYDLEVKKNTL